MVLNSSLKPCLSISIVISHTVIIRLYAASLCVYGWLEEYGWKKCMVSSVCMIFQYIFILCLLLHFDIVRSIKLMYAFCSISHVKWRSECILIDVSKPWICLPLIIKLYHKHTCESILYYFCICSCCLYCIYYDVDLTSVYGIVRYSWNNFVLLFLWQTRLFH